MQLTSLVETSRRVGEAGGRLEKIRLLAGLLIATPPDEIEIATAFLCGSIRQDRLGLGWASLRGAYGDAAADAATLSLAEVDAAFDRIAATGGKGSAQEKQRLLRELLARATRDEQRFLAGLVMGELRQGALEGLVMEAVARAASVPAEEVRRARMMAGDLPRVARAALTEGSAGLSRFSVQLFRPVLPMLAETAEDEASALALLGEAALEYKVDGARIQIHKSGQDVRVFSRRLNEVTGRVPELVEATRKLAARELILDGEAVALRPDGAPHPFQTTMRRFGRKLEIDRLLRELPLSAFFFDLLYLDGSALLDEPLERRFAALSQVLPAPLVIPRLVTAAPAEARKFLEAALTRGHEGIMAKAPDAPYEAGRRGSRWLKVKPVQTLDLVVLAAEWDTAAARAGSATSPGSARSGRGPIRHAGQDLQGHDRRDAGLANDPAARARGRPRRVHRACAAGAGRRGRLQRPPGEPAVPGWARPPVSPGSSATGRTRRPPRLIPWPPSRRCTGARRGSTPSRPDQPAPPGASRPPSGH